MTDTGSPSISPAGSHRGLPRKTALRHAWFQPSCAAHSTASGSSSLRMVRMVTGWQFASVALFGLQCRHGSVPHHRRVKNGGTPAVVRCCCSVQIAGITAKPAKNAADKASKPSSGNTCATYRSGATTAMQPWSRLMPRMSKTVADTLCDRRKRLFVVSQAQFAIVFGPQQRGYCSSRRAARRSAGTLRENR